MVIISKVLKGNMPSALACLIGAHSRASYNAMVFIGGY